MSKNLGEGMLGVSREAALRCDILAGTQRMLRFARLKGEGIQAIRCILKI